MKAPFNMSKNIKKQVLSEANAKDIATQIYHNAQSYHLIVTNSMRTLFPNAIVAITVNAAFSCELYMKSILLLERKKWCNGHRLYQLFNDIQNNSLKKRVVDRLQNYDFYSCLEEIDDVFAIARYVYEYQERSCDLSFVLLFANALSTECQCLLNEQD